MQLHPGFASALSWMRHLAVTAACLALAACGQSQNWSQSSPFIKIGGTVAGLNGTVALSNSADSDSLSVTTNGSFTFPLQVTSGGSYAVAVSGQPSGQSCAVANGSGTSKTDVTTITVTCANVYTIGGAIANLNGTVVLQDNGSNSYSVSGTGASTAFTFPTPVASGAAYAVTVQIQPSGQTCAVTAGGSGNASANVANVAITCVNVYTIAGTISNLSGKIVLQDNGGDTLTVASAGTSTPFRFATPVASGAAYAVTVLTQPVGQKCSVSGGSGTAGTTTTPVSIACANSSGVRALPAFYSTGKAINYSPYRGAGPGTGDTPSNADIVQDLQLLAAAGFNLIRIFDVDPISENVLRIANTTPGLQGLQFHVGSYIEGAPSSCVDTLNQGRVASMIRVANTYSNVAVLSVGNETAFARNLPAACLAQYVQQVRAGVNQPVTADDDAEFYRGASPSGERPDAVLKVIDFVAIHMYPFTHDLSLWNWQQTGVAAGPARAAAMMDASLAYDKSDYAEVLAYMAKVGVNLPVAVTETGWKYKPTNNDPIELITNPAIANPVNAKWYTDLLATWTGAGAPVNIFPFEAFNEVWKHTYQYNPGDDGWGYWDENRNPLYLLCGLTGEAACASPDPYAGAGYYH